MNELIFISHFLIVFFSLGIALRLGKATLTAMFIVMIVMANLYVLKQISLFGLTVTAVEPYSIGAMLCIGLMQEYFGEKEADNTLKAMLFSLVFLGGMGVYQVWYAPHEVDTFHLHYEKILAPAPRIFITSIVVAVSMLYANIYLLRKTKIWFPNISFAIRQTTLLLIIQFFDVSLFSILGLYGIMHNLVHIICMSYAVKVITIAFMGPLMGLLRKFSKAHV